MRGTNTTFTATSTTQPTVLIIAPHHVLAVSLYQNERLKYTPISISAIITMGTALSASQ